jgi:zinc and cadmium transporter
MALPTDPWVAYPRRPGVGTFLVILLHKPFDSMTLITLVRASSPEAARRKVMLLNLLFALIVPVGAFLFLFGAAPMGHASMIVPLALAFSAGTFLCIASSDLLPELQFHRHDRASLSFALVLGLTGAWAIGFLEAEHHHHGAAATCTIEHDHAHDHGGSHDHDHGSVPKPDPAPAQGTPAMETP